MRNYTYISYSYVTYIVVPIQDRKIRMCKFMLWDNDFIFVFFSAYRIFEYCNVWQPKSSDIQRLPAHSQLNQQFVAAASMTIHTTLHFVPRIHVIANPDSCFV